MSKHNNDTGRSKVKSSTSGKRKAKLFVTYWAIAFMIVVMSFYAIAGLGLVSYRLASILFASTVVFAAVATFVHIRKGNKSNIDDIAKKLP